MWVAMSLLVGKHKNQFRCVGGKKTNALGELENEKGLLVSEIIPSAVLHVRADGMSAFRFSKLVNQVEIDWK